MTADPNRKLKVFLCHSSHDKPAVREIYARLQAEGWIDPWLDEEKLFPGQDWDLEIEKAVEETDAVLVFLSDNSVNKEGYIQRELRLILNMADYKPEGTNFILPLRLNDCPLPRRLRSWHCVDNFPDDRKDWAYGRLLGSLKLRAKKVGVDVDALIKEKEEKQKKELAERVRKEQVERKRLEKKAEEDRERKAAAEKAREEKMAREKREAEEKARQAALRKERQQERKDNFKKFFSKNGKRFSLIGGGIVLLFLFSYIISNIEIPVTPERTQTSTTPIEATETLQVPTSTSLPASTPSPTKTSILTEIPATPTPELGIGSTRVSEKDGMTMVYVPAGEFFMGGNPNNSLSECQKFYDNCQYDWFSDEDPVHIIALDPYWVYQTEVTNAMYEECIQAGECNTPCWYDSNTSIEYPDGAVSCVQWIDAKTYCEWAGVRLPTEAEWEKAARGGLSEKKYPWGDESPTCQVGAFNGGRFHYCRNSSSPVASFMANGYGLYDMVGNVSEWVSDWYDAEYYLKSPTENPSGPSSGTSHVLRDDQGYKEFSMLLSGRSEASSSGSYLTVGFRCAMDAE